MLIAISRHVARQVTWIEDWEWPKPGIATFCNMNTPNHSPPPKTLKIGSDFGPRRKRTSQDLFLSLMDSKTFSIENSCSATFFHKHRSPRIRAISFVIRLFPFRCQHAKKIRYPTSQWLAFRYCDRKIGLPGSS